MPVLDMLDTIQDYYWAMAAKKRLLLIDGGRTATVTFFLLDRPDEAETYLTRRPWTTPDDTPTGRVIYIDRYFGKGFNKHIHAALEDAFTAMIPTWQVILWHRPRHGHDVRHTYHRKRRTHGPDLHG